MNDFRINFIDHVAIRVKDIERSVAWYEKLLGLKRCHTPEWGSYPVFMLAGKAGIAIFPTTDDANGPTEKKAVKIDHFAFNVSKGDLEKAKQHYDAIGQQYKFQDHFYSQSIYTNDPDGHTVELTAVLDEEGFYQ